jgi:hypothetical protein
VSVLAHVFEAAGIATIVLSSVRADDGEDGPATGPALRVPARADRSACPNDARVPARRARPRVRVARRAVGSGAGRPPRLSSRRTISRAARVHVAATVRSRPCHRPSTRAARLRKAYDRSLARWGVTSVGRAIDADGVADRTRASSTRSRTAPTGRQRTSPAATPPPCATTSAPTTRKQRSSSPTDRLPGGRALEDVVLRSHRGRRTMLAARTAIRDAGAKFPVWFYMTPGHR